MAAHVHNAAVKGAVARIDANLGQRARSHGDAVPVPQRHAGGSARKQLKQLVLSSMSANDGMATPSASQAG